MTQKQSKRQQPTMTPEEEAAAKRNANLQGSFAAEQALGYKVALGAMQRTPAAPTDTTAGGGHHIPHVRGLDTNGPAGPVVEKNPDDLTDQEREAIMRDGEKDLQRKRFRGQGR